MIPSIEEESDYSGVIIFSSMVCVVVVLLSLVIYSEYLKVREWEQFRIEHDCRVTSMIDGEWGDSVIWTCNDGITYEKRR